MASVNSTASTQSSSSLSGIKGFGGMASGIDTDTLVASLTNTEQTKIDKQNQQVQKLEWQQEAYREIITKMQSFQSKYLDITSKTDITRSASFNTITASASGKAVSVTTNSESFSTSFTINSIQQLASGMKIASGRVSGNIIGSVDLMSLLNGEDYTNPENIEGTTLAGLAGKSLSFTLDGSTKAVAFDNEFMESFYAAYDSSDPEGASKAFQSALQGKLDSAFGAGRIDVSYDANGGLKLDTAKSSALSVYAVGDDKAPLETLGIVNGATNKINLNKQISSLEESQAFAKALAEDIEADEEGIKTYKIEINGVEFSIKNNTSLRSVMNQINNSNAGVNLTYSEISDTFTLTSTATGSGANIEIKDEDGFLASLGLVSGASAEEPTVTEGQNAVFFIDGERVERESNKNISVNGMFLTLEATSEEAIQVETSADTSSLKDMIVGFVNDYNEMIEMINKARKEERSNDYAPLTDAQKKEMSDSEIEKWEEKAKAGILRNDTTLNSISSKLNSLMYTKFNGFSFYEMGVQSAGYTENGKLTIDEDKLDTALSTKSEQVKDFFLGETGFGNAMKNAVNSAVKTSGPKGSRGSLIEKAGIGNTASDTENNITSKIKDIKKYIETLQDRLEQRQQYWWKKFSALESLVSNMDGMSSLIGAYTSN